MSLKLLLRKRNVEKQENREQTARRGKPFEPADPLKLDTDQLYQYVQLERYGLIAANPKHWEGHPDIKSVYRTAMERIDQAFAVVPEGFVSLPHTVHDYPGCPEQDIETQPFLLACCAVTNAQFQKFVDTGGYGDLSLWAKDIWPHLIDFKDQTGAAGPRFWQNGRHDKNLANHPVVGLCYYEAAAYARWAGFRLPDEAEWQMAASWRIRSSAHVLRRYPWGDALDTDRCNIWSSGVGGTVPVDSYPLGAAPNGALQLIGNVWEWTASDFMPVDENGKPIVGDMLMKSIRGGAFDTYFACQATSYFRTGLPCLVRAHNVGFRCALDVRQSRQQ
jgi:iron(II)-dependent oxidoreductase